MTTNSDKQRGAKRGVLDSGRAKQLDKTRDASADSADDEPDDAQTED